MEIFDLLKMGGNKGRVNAFKLGKEDAAADEVEPARALRRDEGDVLQAVG